MLMAFVLLGGTLGFHKKLLQCSPEKYRLAERLADPNPIISWTVSQHRNEIQPGDIAFLWETGQNRGVRAVLCIDEGPRDMHELDTERRYWHQRDEVTRCRVVGTLIRRGVSLSGEQLRQVPGLGQLSVFHGFQQATNFPVSDAE